MQELLYRSWAEIDLDKLRHNVNTIKSYVGSNTKFMAIVKADAYGHGVLPLINTLRDSGVDAYGVSNILEARNLRRGGVKEPILILGHTPVDHADELANLEITQSLLNLDYAKELSDAASKLGKTIKCHIKLDTGMGRIGFDSRDEQNCCEKITEAVKLPGLEVNGLFTHFAVADEDSIESKNYTVLQHQRFVDVIEKLSEAGVSFKTVHCCNSAGTLYYPEFHHDMVRVGISLYGLSPNRLPVELDLKPLMSLKTTVTQIKQLHEGETISYGRSFTCPRDMIIATVPIGYADGYPRSLSNRALAWFKTSTIRQVGTICMDQLMFDVTGIDIKIGDEITLFGGDSPISLENIAGIADYTNYEFVCGFSRRLPRVYIEDGKTKEIVDYSLR